MFDLLFRTNEVNQSTTLGVALSVSASIFLSFLLVITYRLTSREVVERREFMQGMALISIVAATIMQAIGDSVAQGLGILGALSIIRFRTNLASPRNMAFMFASLGAGIGCGVFGFTIAGFGTIAFCLVAFALAYRRGEDASQLIGELRVAVPPESLANRSIEKILKQHCRRVRLKEFRFTRQKVPTPVVVEGAPIPEPVIPPLVKDLHYEFLLGRKTLAHELLNEIEEIPDVVGTRMRFERGSESL